MMHDQIWKVSDPIAIAGSSNHWRESSFGHADSAESPRPGHSLAGVGVRQSVAPTLQAKLSVSQPNDRAEVEADNMAKAVMSMPAPESVASRQEDEEAMAMHIQRKCTVCQKDAAKLDQPDAGKDGEGTDTQTATSDEQVSAMPEEEEQVSAMPEEEEQVSAMPEEEEQVSAMPEEEEQVSAMPEEEEQVSAMPEEEEQVSAMPEEEEQVSAMPEEEEQVSAMPEEEEVATKSDDEEQAATSAQGGATPNVTPGVESQIRSVQSGGAPLSRESREFFEPRFGSDFSDVRIQTGAQASNVAQQLNAKAFTVGSNITFGEGQYSPSNDAGKHLLAHELTHVVQQRGKR